MQVSWYETHLFLESVLAKANCGSLPWAGTPAWCAMEDSDPRKLFALAQFGVKYALRIDTDQQAQADAAADISEAADWSAVAQQVQCGRGSAYIPREVA